VLTVIAPDAMPRELAAAVQEITPDSQVVFVPKAGPLPAEVASAEVFYRSAGLSRERTDEILARGDGIRWMHLPFAGVDGLLPAGLQDRGIAVTHAVGLYDVPVAELVMSFILATAKRLPLFAEGQRAARWMGVSSWDNASALTDMPAMLRDQTVGIVGFGGIGRALARLLHPFGTRVLGLRLSGGEEPLADRMYGPGGLEDLLAQSDYVVLAAPLTEETRGLIGKDQIAAMRPGAWLINIGRGALVQDEALIGALTEHAIAGACLDVFVSEPLPPEHPYYRLPNVVLTPHIGGVFADRTTAEIRLFTSELARYVSGEPFLGPVRLDLGY
jgi:phosphoglycerate dehydrogenase-like enzyme